MPFFVGTPLTLRAVFTEAGAPLTAACKLTVEPPDGVKEFYLDCTGGGGLYQRDYTPNAPGYWQYAFEDTNTGAYQNGAFEVVARPV